MTSIGGGSLTRARRLVRAVGEGDDVEAGVICTVCSGSH